LAFFNGYELWRLPLFSFGGYGLALVDFGAYDSYPVSKSSLSNERLAELCTQPKK